VSAVVLSPKPDGGHPLIDQPGILSRTDVIGVIRSAREHEVVQRAATALQPLKQARPSRFEQFELHRPAGLLLNYDGSLADATTAHQLADPDLDQITASKLAVDAKIEQRSISEPMLLL
jgi:hypothetical protein